MFDLSPEKLLLVGIIALLVLGPERLPKAAHSVGRVLAQLRAMSGNLQNEMGDVLSEPRRAFNDAMTEAGLPTSMPTVPSVRRVVTDALTAPYENRSSNPEPVDVPSYEASSLADEAANGQSRALPDDPTLN
ncbi:MAG TPA: twin-arginine translocase TatA/TatE family subunit [Acidimicrobiales bacterium]|nr:twin-arginine translocase TatA/TatE family subunit [Acidimicrobiales bacterium]